MARTSNPLKITFPQDVETENFKVKGAPDGIGKFPKPKNSAELLAVCGGSSEMALRIAIEGIKSVVRRSFVPQVSPELKLARRMVKLGLAENEAAGLAILEKGRK